MGVLLVACQGPTNSKITEPKLIEFLEKIGVNQQIVNDANQLIIVKTKDWEDKNGICYLFERKNKLFNYVKSFEIVLGRNGMRWGQGLHNVQDSNIKKEGDGTTPAGVFLLGDGFGNEPVFLMGGWPFRQTTQYDYFIDDSNSKFYNSWVDKRDVAQDWDSYETMLRDDGLYNRGLVIRHNMEPVKPMFGSAIFFHIWRHKNHGTAGCTALSKKNMEALLNWIKKDSNPLVIQLPKNYLDKLL